MRRFREALIYSYYFHFFVVGVYRLCDFTFIPASNVPNSRASRMFGKCREGQIPAACGAANLVPAACGGVFD